MAGFSRDLISRYAIYFTGVGWLTPPTRVHARRHGIWDSRRLLSTANRERHAFESATAWFERTCRSSAAGRDRSLDRLTGGVRSLSRTALDPRGSNLDRTNLTPAAGRVSGRGQAVSARGWFTIRSRMIVNRSRAAISAGPAITSVVSGSCSSTVAGRGRCLHAVSRSRELVCDRHSSSRCGADDPGCMHVPSNSGRSENRGHCLAVLRPPQPSGGPFVMPVGSRFGPSPSSCYRTRMAGRASAGEQHRLKSHFLQ